MSDPIDPKLIVRWQLVAVKVGLVLSAVGALVLILSSGIGLVFIGVGALLIYYARPSGSQRRAQEPKEAPSRRRDRVGGVGSEQMAELRFAIGVFCWIWVLRLSNA